jgi:S-adenosylmethionine hydrolase
MSIITLLSDFGVGSPYVASMKGAILSLHPAASLVDISHAVPPQDVRFASVVWEDVAEPFPAGTIHVAVVDPGVGTDRALVYAKIGRQCFLCPDNGLLSRLALKSPPSKVVRLTQGDYWRRPVSATFHGRDILAPVAAHLSLGLDPDHLGVPQSELVMLDWPAIQRREDGIEGSVLACDSFGNLITDLMRAMLPEASLGQRLRIACCGREVAGLSRVYGESPRGALIALFGSTDRLELAVVGGNAAAMLGAAPGDRATVRWGNV